MYLFVVVVYYRLIHVFGSLFFFFLNFTLVPKIKSRRLFTTNIKSVLLKWSDSNSV